MIGRDGENGRNGIDREDEVHDVDQDQDQKQRREHEPPVDADHKTASVEFRRDRQHLAAETHEEIFLEIELRVAIEEHAQAGEKQKRAENVENEMEPFHQRHPQPDHRAAHDERPENSPD